MSERQQAYDVAGGIMRKLERIRQLWLDGHTDAEISAELGGSSVSRRQGEGWSAQTVKRYRRVLRLIDPERPAWRHRRAS